MINLNRRCFISLAHTTREGALPIAYPQVEDFVYISHIHRWRTLFMFLISTSGGLCLCFQYPRVCWTGFVDVSYIYGWAGLSKSFVFTGAVVSSGPSYPRGEWFLHVHRIHGCSGFFRSFVPTGRLVSSHSSHPRVEWFLQVPHTHVWGGFFRSTVCRQC